MPDSPGLSRVSDKAIEINRMVEKPLVEKRVELSEEVRELVSRLSEDYPEATIETSIDAEAVRTDPRILRKVVEEAVADDGPGIPESELDPVLDGEESSLEHASSFGLWFVNWGAQTLGVGVDITTSGAGTRVTLQVPDSGQIDDSVGNARRRSPLLSRD